MDLHPVIQATLRPRHRRSGTVRPIYSLASWPVLALRVAKVWRRHRLRLRTKDRVRVLPVTWARDHRDSTLRPVPSTLTQGTDSLVPVQTVCYGAIVKCQDDSLIS